MEETLVSTSREEEASEEDEVEGIEGKVRRSEV